MKTDNYLTLCLEQATKSPLHYRHGCIVVRGGKVIGQGHNDYRPGFDGGALKHGRVASSALNGPALADMKAKLKQRKANKLSSKEKEAAFERSGNGGGPQANTPLSMHSEMMAIHSALSTSSTMACSTGSREKPSFKLSRGDKKKERLRRDVLKSYVESICASAGTISACSGKLQVQECGFEEKGIGKHQNQYGKNGKHHEYEYGYQKQQQRGFPGQQQPQPSASKLKPVGELEIRFDDRKMTDNTLMTGPAKGASKRGLKGSRKSKSVEQPNEDQLLLPQGETGKASGRKKDPRLVGADLYVTRLGWNKSQVSQKQTKKAKAKAKMGQSPAPIVAPETASGTTSEAVSEAESDGPPSLSSSTSSMCTLGTTGSLHDELRNRSPPTPPPAALEHATSTIPREAIHDSRPCYRCISYMHAVGIKRVFWTNDAGDWEGGKVANLVNALHGGADGSESGGGPMGNGIFVTKHEVLNMRRTMGGG